MVNPALAVAFLISLIGMALASTSTESEGDIEGKAGDSKNGSTMAYSERPSTTKLGSKTEASGRYQAAKALMRKLNDTLRENAGQRWSDAEAHALRQDLQEMVEFLQQHVTSRWSDVFSRSSDHSANMKAPIVTYEADWLWKSARVEQFNGLEAHQTTESGRRLGEGVGDEAGDWVLEYGNNTCYGGKQLTASLAGIDGGARDAAKCGSLAAGDGGCNPMYVYVRTKPPYEDCFCATADTSCELQQFNSAFAVFQKRTALSPTSRTPAATAPTPAPNKADCFENDVKYAGYDIDDSMLTSSSAEQCQLECQGVQLCRYFTWTPLNGRCKLKSMDKGRQSLSDRISGPRVCQAACSWTKVDTHGEGSTLCHGSDAGWASANSAEKCKAFFLEDPRCWFITWQADLYQCGCKTACNDVRHQANRWSFHKTCQAQDGYEIIGNGNCEGAKGENSRQYMKMNPSKCRARCSEDLSCTGYDIDQRTSCSLRDFAITSTTASGSATCYRKLQARYVHMYRNEICHNQFSRWQGPTGKSLDECFLECNARPECTYFASWPGTGQAFPTAENDCRIYTGDCERRSPVKDGYHNSIYKMNQACSAGMKRTVGESGCTPCDPGRYSRDNAILCKYCNNGTIPNNDQSGCTPCETGWVSEMGAADCVQCVGGKIPNAPLNNDCVQCQAGRQSNSGDIACTPCRADEVAKVGSSQCTQCVEGTIPDTRQETCTVCAAGKFSTSGSSSCKACEAGKYSSRAAHVCGSCESGEVPNDPKSACRKCDAGTTSSRGDSACTACGKGKYNDGHMQSTCLACPLGTFSKSVGMTACAECAPGSYAGLRGTTACAPCRPGYFNAAPMMSICDPCRPGKFSSTPGAITCEPCSAGRYNDRYGLNYSCRECPKGKHISEPMQATCENCPLGRFTAEAGTSRCQRCSDARMTTMSKVLVDGGQQQWAYRDGAKDESWCGCDKQTRQTDAGSCVDCEEGVDCVGMGEFFVKFGYAAELLENGELSIFKCHGLEVRCKGGTPGKTCAEGREGVSCARCVRLWTPSSDGTCVKCGKRDMLPLVLTCFGAVLLLMLMYCLVVATNKAKRSTWLLLCGMSCSIMVTCMQQLNIIRMVSIRWPAPLMNVFNILGIFAFDIELVRMHCVATTSSLGMFSGKLCMIGVSFIALILIHVGFVWIFHRGRFREHSPSLVCGLGLLVMVLYTSLTSIVLEPLQCLPNPNGKKTVSGYQAVVCWQTQEHVMMVSVGVIALLVPVSYLIHSIVVVNRFPQKMMQGDTRFLRMYMFLFFRYRKEMYWYSPVHIFRSLLLSITPIIPNVVGQLITMQILTMAHLGTTIYLVPWRSQLANLLEATVMSFILLVLSVASLLVEETPVFEIVCLAIAVVCAIAIAVLLMISYALLVYFSKRRRKAFDYFLCHHKAGARCFVRLLRMHLRDLNSTAFLDSDNLSDLDRLFDYVACDTKNLVVVCSKDILMRPWCVGEIVTGMLHHVTTVQVMFAEFEVPSDDFIQQYDAHADDLSVLSSRGIDSFMIKEGLRWLLSVPAFELPSHATKNTMDSLVMRMSKICGKGKIDVGRVTFRKDQFPNDAQVVILLDHSNFETNACALVLIKFLAPHLMSQPELAPHILPQKEALPEVVEVLIILCTSGIFQKPYFLRSLGTAAGRPRGCFHIPIMAESTFRFPTRELLEDSRATVASVCDDEEAMFSLILDVFMSIALDFQPERTEDMLRTQASEVAKRLTSDSGHTNKKVLLSHVQSKFRTYSIGSCVSSLSSLGSSSLECKTADSKISL